MKYRMYSLCIVCLVIAAQLTITNSGLASNQLETHYTVNDTNDLVDINPGDGICATVNGTCTLRAAIMEANTDIDTDTIMLAAGKYVLSISGANEDNCATGDLDIRNSLSITGDQIDSTIIDASFLGDRAIQILPLSGPVSISFVQIQGGSTTGDGGGINSSYMTDLIKVNIRLNHADGDGGGIYSNAPLTLTGGELYQNSADNYGGGAYIENQLDVNGTAFTANSANYGGGLGLYQDFTANLIDTTFMSNTVSQDGAAIRNIGRDLFIQQSDFIGNTAGYGGGGIFTGYSAYLKISNVNFIRNSCGSAGAGIDSFQGDVLGQDVSFRSNTTGINPGYGGAIYNSEGSINIERGVFYDNSTRSGGAIGNNADSTFNLIDSLLMDNNASIRGGGIYNDGTMTLQRVTLYSNQAPDGGGIYNENLLAITNSTISQNSATYNGGGVNNLGTAFVNSSTIASNVASATGFLNYFGGGIYAAPGSSSTLRNTILFGNIHWRTTYQYEDDCYGTLNSQHYNLIGSLVTCTLNSQQGELIGVDPQLGPMRYNGGLTPTRALNSNSPAIDAANPAGCIDHLGTPLLTDQRGFPRSLDGNSNGSARCDIGAYERAIFSYLPITQK